MKKGQSIAPNSLQNNYLPKHSLYKQTEASIQTPSIITISNIILPKLNNNNNILEYYNIYIVYVNS